MGSRCSGGIRTALMDFSTVCCAWKSTINLNRGAAFRARESWATPKLTDGARDGRAAVVVDLLAVEVESAYPGFTQPLG
jgi:hypothetical protein